MSQWQPETNVLVGEPRGFRQPPPQGDEGAGFGQRVQYSVFECLLTPAQVVEVQRRLRKLVGKNDSVRFYFISADDGRSRA